MENNHQPAATERETTFLASQITPQSRRVDHLTYSLWMISSIPPALHNESDFLAYACMVDAFFVHVRLLAEFLVKKTNQADFGPNDLLQDWAHPDSGAAQRLQEHWVLASRHVVHFSDERVPSSLADLKPLALDHATLRSIADDVLNVMSEFVVMAEQQKIGHAERLRDEYQLALGRLRGA